MIDGAQQGPMSKTALMRRGVKADTPVWAQGFPSWLTMATVPELKAMLDNTPFTSFFPLEKKNVSIFGAGLNNTSGKLWMFDDYFMIDPSIAASILTSNFSRTGYVRQYYGYEEIAAYNSGFMARCSITMRDGKTVKLAINGKKKIFEEMERRRQHWYAQRNMPVPPVTMP